MHRFRSVWSCRLAASAAEPVSFRNEVMAVLSRAGCNQGACHGNQNGKGGFKLSLRGEDPAFDFASLTRDMLGRRADPLRPADSLILLKATDAPCRTRAASASARLARIRLLRRWIAAGMRPDPPDAPTLRSARGHAARASPGRAGRPRAAAGRGHLLRRQRCAT